MFKVLLGIISVTLIWGYTWVTMKIAITDIPPVLFSALRLFIGAVPLFVILLIKGRKRSIGKENIKHYLVMSLLMGLGYMGVLTYGMQFVDSGKTSVLVYTMPIFVTVISHFKLNEKINVYKMLGLFSGLIGLLFILGGGILHVDQNVIFGELCVLTAALSWGIANVYSKLKFKDTDMIHMNAWQLLTGAVMLLIFSFILEPARPIHWSNEAILSLLFNGLFSTALTFVIWFWILNQIEASKASMALMFVPVLGLLFGWLQLHEPVTISILIGAFMICIGIFMNTYQFKKV
ncbi:DMT family transporter [Bacillus paralicheniformis]|uniref:DMT family transporter n=1 Tax=Bacillus paralicheniformis TaxID=1648923 RepID=A0AAW6K915_9BACI|nr:DMT family transporter [Bacillus paralicheniformis]MDE1451029.1 DMT family transporter [Bacillus paralicheniformis]MED1712732.1 DMT family transporter [Bacillus paralicheniformis]QSF98161.1 DMT family transporter [Bacillus paralicheniformis]TWK86445.1 putative cystine transporter YijE [Bacillus paralicheniformis]